LSIYCRQHTPVVTGMGLFKNSIDGGKLAWYNVCMIQQIATSDIELKV